MKTGYTDAAGPLPGGHGPARGRRPGRRPAALARHGQAGAAAARPRLPRQAVTGTPRDDRRRRPSIAAGAAAVARWPWSSAAVVFGASRSAAARRRAGVRRGAGSADRTPEPLAQLPRGGRTILPRYRVVAYYGAPEDPQLGALGIGTPAHAGAELAASQASRHAAERRTAARSARPGRQRQARTRNPRPCPARAYRARAVGRRDWLELAERIGDAYGLVLLLIPITFVVMMTLPPEGWGGRVAAVAVAGAHRDRRASPAPTCASARVRLAIVIAVVAVVAALLARAHPVATICSALAFAGRLASCSASRPSRSCAA